MAQQIIINSTLREAGSASATDFVYNIQDLTREEDDLQISIGNITIPRVYFSINSRNDTLALGTSQTITLKHCTPTPTQFITDFQNKNSLGITVAYDTSTLGFTFTSGVTAFNITVPTDTSYKYLGLIAGNHVSIGVTAPFV